MNGMTALASPATVSPTADRPSVGRLIGGMIVGAIGAVVLSIGIGNFVVGSSHAVVPAQGDVARALVATTPAFVAIGLLHVLAAVVLVRGRDLLRVVAVFTTALGALAAATSAAMLAAGVDPFGGTGGGHPATGAVGVLVVAAVLYGSAAVAGGSGPVEG